MFSLKLLQFSLHFFYPIINLILIVYKHFVSTIKEKQLQG